MDQNQIKIFNQLRGCSQAIAFMLREHPQTRDMDVDQFLYFFKDKNRFAKWSSETIRRSRQKVQNTFQLYPRKEKLDEWGEPIKRLNVNHVGQVSFL